MTMAGFALMIYLSGAILTWKEIDPARGIPTLVRAWVAIFWVGMVWLFLCFDACDWIRNVSRETRRRRGWL